jgi:hypothetical protein
MNDDSLQTSFWIMILIQTIGSVDMPGKGPRKMPAPRQYVAIVVTWLILQLAAGASEGAARGAKALGWLLVLTGLVVGPFGKTAVGFLNTIAQQFSTAGLAGNSLGVDVGKAAAQYQNQG